MILYGDIAGERLDAFLARCVEGLTRSGAQRLLEEGCVTRNGKAGRACLQSERAEAPGPRIPAGRRL